MMTCRYKIIIDLTRWKGGTSILTYGKSHKLHNMCKYLTESIRNES